MRWAGYRGKAAYAPSWRLLHSKQPSATICSIKTIPGSVNTGGSESLLEVQNCTRRNRLFLILTHRNYILIKRFCKYLLRHHVKIIYMQQSLEEIMAYNPFDEEEEEELEGSMDLEMIRDDIIAELKSINEYEAQVDMLDSEDAADTIEQILENKKEHVAKLVKLLKALDPVQAEKLDNELK
jgi:hypothetical protein